MVGGTCLLPDLKPPVQVMEVRVIPGVGGRECASVRRRTQLSVGTAVCLLGALQTTMTDQVAG